MTQTPGEPKRGAGPAVVVVLVVVAVVVTLLAWALARQDGAATPLGPTTPTTPGDSQSPDPFDITPTGSGTNAGHPFCLAYVVNGVGMGNWAAYQLSITAGDYAGADAYVSTFLADVEDMQRADPPPEAVTPLEDMVAYLTKVHEALQAGSLDGVSAEDTQGFTETYLKLTQVAVPYCYN